MKRSSIRLATLAAVLAIGAGAALAQEERIPPRAHPAIWEIDKGNSRVYLFGSLHILPVTLAWVDPNIEIVMKESDDFVFEVSVDDDALAAQKTFIIQHGLLPPGITLHDMLSQRDFYTYSSVLMRSGLPKVQFDHYRPWLASLVLGLAYLHRDIANLRGADDVLLEYAQSHGKGIVYLETIEDQMKLLIGGDDKAQLTGLQSVISALPQERAHQQELLEAWSAGDADRVSKIIDSYFRGREAAREFLLGARNRAWLARLDALLGSGKTTLVTVGAAHVGGDSGLIAGLCAKGYTVALLGPDARPGPNACGPKA